MAKRKIIWSNRAMKKLYAILESDFRRRNDKILLRELFNRIFNSINLLLGKPRPGKATSDDSVFVLKSGEFLFFYGIKNGNILIFTISEMEVA